MFAAIAGAFIALVGFFVILQRRRLAQAQALVLGGSVLPGCAIVEGMALIAIGAAIAFFGGSVQ